LGGTRSEVEGGNRHDLEPEGMREDTRHEIYTQDPKEETLMHYQGKGIMYGFYLGSDSGFRWNEKDQRKTSLF
jgi:hypothetical protein